MDVKLWHGFAALVVMSLVLLGVNLGVMLASPHYIKDASDLRVFLYKGSRLADLLSWGGLLSGGSCLIFCTFFP